MKIICFMVIMIEIMKEVHSLKCYNHTDDKDPQPTECKAKNAKCAYVIVHKPKEPKRVERKCIEKDFNRWISGKCIKRILTTACTCDADFCNYNCSVGLCPDKVETKLVQDKVETQMRKKEECDAICKAAAPEENGTTPTDATTKNKTKTNSIDDNAQVTSDDGPEPTDDITGATGEEGPQSTEDGIGATGEDGPQPTEDRSGASAETQNPTGRASTTSGNLSVQFLFALLMLTTLVIRSPE